MTSQSTAREKLQAFGHASLDTVLAALSWALILVVLRLLEGLLTILFGTMVSEKVLAGYHTVTGVLILSFAFVHTIGTLVGHLYQHYRGEK